MVVPITTCREILQCKSCKTTFEYNPTIQLVPMLVFEKDGKRTSYTLTSSIIIGRESKTDYITLRNEIDKFLKQDTYIRNHFVSRQPHAKITLNEECSLLFKGDNRRIIVKKKCFIEDCGSRNGTSVNDSMLKPNEKRELKHKDRITLAQLSALPLVVIYEESMHNL